MFKTEGARAQMTIDNPYEAPLAEISSQTKEEEKGRTYGGIGRGIFFGLMILIGAVSEIETELFPEESEARETAIALVQMAGFIVIAGLRIKNMGQSPWWGLSLLIPLYNLIVLIRCLAYPKGWADHRKLDTAGKIIAGLILGFILLMAGGMLLAVVLLAGIFGIMPQGLLVLFA